MGLIELVHRYTQDFEENRLRFVIRSASQLKGKSVAYRELCKRARKMYQFISRKLYTILMVTQN